MAKYSLISVKGSVENIRNLVQQAFESSGFVVRWENQTKGRAEKGSMGANIALGAWAQHHAVDFDIMSGAEGGTLRLIKTGSGMAGGLLGMRKVNKQFDLLSDTLAAWFTHQGLLLSVRKE